MIGERVALRTSEEPHHRGGTVEGHGGRNSWWRVRWLDGTGSMHNAADLERLSEAAYRSLLLAYRCVHQEGEANMIFAALSEAAERGELLLVSGGLCRFHARQDGVVVIREILVLSDGRRLGRGRAMVETVQQRHPHAKLRARCPVVDARGAVGAANTFWKHMGFTLVDTREGLNTWERSPS